MHDTPTDADLIRWAQALADRVWAEVFRHPGADPDDADELAWQQTMRPLAQGIASRRINAASLNADDPRKPSWEPGVWKLIFGIRNAERRPRWPEVQRLAAEHLGVPYPQTMTGEEAAARRIVTAPEPLALPAPPIASDPSWLGRFPSMDGGGPFDRAMMLCLTKMPEAKAQETIDLIETQRRERRRVAADRVVAEAEKRQARLARERGDDMVGDLLRRVAVRRAAQ